MALSVAEGSGVTSSYSHSRGSVVTECRMSILYSVSGLSEHKSLIPRPVFNQQILLIQSLECCVMLTVCDNMSVCYYTHYIRFVCII